MVIDFSHFLSPPWSPLVEVSPKQVQVLDQTRLPFEEIWLPIRSMEDAAHAIRSMQVRGAPLLSITAAFGLALQMDVDASDQSLSHAIEQLNETRPTAVNLRWALARMNTVLAPLPAEYRPEAAWAEARAIAAEDIQTGAAIAQHGFEVVRELYEQKKNTVILNAAKRSEGSPGIGAQSVGDPSAKPQDDVTGLPRSHTLPRNDGAILNILTHCNAGWLGTMAWGTALAVMYAAQHFGIPIHVYVDETRPRFQGALTAWELQKAGISHQIITDNAGGHLMQEGLVDIVIVGADRVARNGDTANKIGTYLKALAAKDNNIPFYVALPSTTFDFTLASGIRNIPIEERAAAEVLTVTGRTAKGKIATVSPYPENSLVSNPGFDVTPARLITGLITERGVCDASEAGIMTMFGEE